MRTGQLVFVLACALLTYLFLGMSVARLESALLLVTVVQLECMETCKPIKLVFKPVVLLLNQLLAIIAPIYV